MDPPTEHAYVHFSPGFGPMCGWIMQYGTVRARRGLADSDADVALIIAEGAADWQLVGTLAELA